MGTSLVIHLTWAVRKVDQTIHWINHYPGDSVVCFVNTNCYPLDGDLCHVFQPVNNWGLTFGIEPANISSPT